MTWLARLFKLGALGGALWWAGNSRGMLGIRRSAALAATFILVAMLPNPSVAHDPSICEGGAQHITDVRVDLYDDIGITGPLIDTNCYNGNANGGNGVARDLLACCDDRTESLSIRYVPSQGDGPMLVSLVNTDPVEDHVLAFWCIDSNPNHFHINLATIDQNKTDRVTVAEAGGSSC